MFELVQTSVFILLAAAVICWTCLVVLLVTVNMVLGFEALTLWAPGGGLKVPYGSLIAPRCFVGGGRDLKPHDFLIGIL